MGWFEEAWPWVPPADAEGHELGPGRVNFTFVNCDCPAVTDGRGHQTVRCRVNGCHAEPIRPPGCTGVKDQR